MSKAEFFQEIMPSVKELTVGCLAMDTQDYEAFKSEVMEECDIRTKRFLCAVLSVIDKVREKKKGGGRKMMTNFIADVEEAVGAFAAMREARERGRRPSLKVMVEMPIIKAGPAFYDTPEGCMFANRDKELHNAVWEVFEGLSYEDKMVLCFVPEPGRYLLRVQLWRDALEPVLSPKLYHKAMGAILHQYVEIKRHSGKTGRSDVA